MESQDSLHADGILIFCVMARLDLQWTTFETLAKLLSEETFHDDDARTHVSYQAALLCEKN